MVLELLIVLVCGVVFDLCIVDILYSVPYRNLGHDQGISNMVSSAGMSGGLWGPGFENR